LTLQNDTIAANRHTLTSLCHIQAFEAVVPNELTRLRLHIIDGSIHLVAPNVATQLMLCIQKAHVSANIIPDVPRSTTGLQLSNVELLAIDGPGDVLDVDTSSRSACEHWKVGVHILS
jgi:hypothetical protein